MEVSGKEVDPTKDNTNLHCLPCQRDGLQNQAHGYCQNCEEHLCKTCYQDRKRPKPCRNHILLDKDEMPQQQTTDDFKSDDITSFCTSHKDKLLEFYCKTHESLVCYVCATLKHKKCKVDFIPDVSRHVYDELADLVTKMEELVKKCESNIRNAQTATRNVDQNREKIIEEISLFRKEINAHLDQMQSRMMQETEFLVNAAKNTFKNVKYACEEIAEELKCSQSFLNSLRDENKNNKLFIEMKNIGPRVVTLTEKEKQTTEHNKASADISFVRNGKLLEQLKLENSLGMFSMFKIPSADTAISLQYERTITVKSSSDDKICDISGMVIVPTSRMIVADNSNKKIKMIDATNDRHITEITVSSEPRDVIKLPQNKLAVAFWNEKCIQILSYTDTRLLLDRRLALLEKCNCLAYCQGKLVVGFNCNQGELVILDLDGNIQQVFDTPGFAGPEKIVISRDKKFLYLSNYRHRLFGDTKTNMLMKIDMQGNIVHTFEQPKCQYPKGIQELEDGTLLVCYMNRHTIVRLSSSLKRYELSGLEKANLLRRPGTITYSERDHKLYISCSSTEQLYKNDIVKVFHIKWV